MVPRHPAAESVSARYFFPPPKLISAPHKQPMDPIFPEEIIEEIAIRLPFEAVNSFARTCLATARVVSRVAVNIADRHAVFDHRHFDDRFKADDGIDDLVVVSHKLPNGVPHGNISFIEYRTTLLRVTYQLGRPTYWRSTDADGDCFWGHVLTPFYVISQTDDFSRMHAQLKIDGDHTVTCARVGSTVIQKIIDAEDVILRELPSDLPPPATMHADGNICLEEMNLWGNRIIAYIRAHGIISPDTKILLEPPFMPQGTEMFADFVASQCPRFNETRLVEYRPS